ncbi:hypothetical protein Taro_037688 [Colocasia esculenta]|uniref:Uncharacterized protein n=1 Tax=Colocasia esculenta TaxID=4460 RepID=A0A843WGZ8_COLES|nr:hypothetical protein [Colocasia esculenta]
MQERIISGRWRDEDNDDEPKIFAEYVPDQPLRRTKEQTRVESWEAEQRRSFEVGSAYYLHPAYHYAMELSYDDDLTAAFTRVVERLSRSALDAVDMKSFQEGVGSFAEPSAIAGRDRIDGKAAEEEGEHGDVGGGRQPHSSQIWAEEDDEVDLLGDLQMERAMPSTGGANLDDDMDFERLMLGPCSQSMKEAPAIASSQPKRKGSHMQFAAPS